MGKAVRININLFPEFALLVDPASHDGQQTIRQIESLRQAGGAHQGSMANTSNAFKFMAQAHKLTVYYTILNGEDDRKEVFITDIGPCFNQSNADKAGLYMFSKWKGKYLESTSLNLEDQPVYINGRCDDLTEAIKHGKKRIPNLSSDLAVFYTPSHVVNEMGVWRSSKQSAQTKDAIAKLSEVMKKNQKKRVYWIAEAEGASVACEAANAVNGIMDNFRMRFIDPIADAASLIPKLKNKGIRLGGGDEDTASITYTGTNRTSDLMKSSQLAQLTRELQATRPTPLNKYAHEAMVTELASSPINDTIGTSKSSLKNHQMMQHRPGNPSQIKKAPHIKHIALTFVTALKRV
ncbi:MAG: hypothetical protein ACI9Y1_000706 [Lentisphaeria bacterium]